MDKGSVKANFNRAGAPDYLSRPARDRRYTVVAWGARPLAALPARSPDAPSCKQALTELLAIIDGTNTKP